MSGFDFTWRNIESNLRLAVPQMLLALFVVLSFLAVPDGGGSEPYFVLMAIYYWAIYRPTLVPSYLCFGTGLLIDILSGAPLGLHALIFILMRWIISDQRRFLMGQSYITLWAVFCLIAALAAAIQWGVFGLLHMEWPFPTDAMISVGLSIFLFPFVTLLLIRVHRLLPVASKVLPRVS
jgi:rod shape-determining protein MreD